MPRRAPRRLRQQRQPPRLRAVWGNDPRRALKWPACAYGNTLANQHSWVSKWHIPLLLHKHSHSIASRLKEAQNTAAMLTTFQEVRMLHIETHMYIHSYIHNVHARKTTGGHGQPHRLAKQVQGRLREDSRNQTRLHERLRPSIHSNVTGLLTFNFLDSQKIRNHHTLTWHSQELPAVNGVIDDSTNEIIYRNYVDISVAVNR